MCRRITCNVCAKPSFAGCGLHVESVLGDVAPADRCRCGESAETGARPGEAGGAAGQSAGGPAGKSAGGLAGQLTGALAGSIQRIRGLLGLGRPDRGSRR